MRKNEKTVDDMAAGLKNNLNRLLKQSVDEELPEPQLTEDRWSKNEPPTPAGSKLDHQGGIFDGIKMNQRTTVEERSPENDRRLKNRPAQNEPAISGGSNLIQREHLSYLIKILSNVRLHILTTGSLSQVAKTVALYLFEESLRTGEYECEISGRELATAIGSSRTTVIRALDELLNHRFILFLRGENQNFKSKIDVLDIIMHYCRTEKIPLERRTIIESLYQNLRWYQNCTSDYEGRILNIISSKDNKDLSIYPSCDSAGSEMIPPSRLIKPAYSTLENILYFLATYGLNIKSITSVLFNRLVASLSIKGDALTRNQEYVKTMNSFMIIGKYVAEHNRGHPWSLFNKLLNGDFVEKNSSPELLERMDERLGKVTDFIKTPSLIELKGAAELKNLAEEFGIKISPISPETIASVRRVITMYFTKAAEDAEYTLRHYGVEST